MRDDFLALSNASARSRSQHVPNGVLQSAVVLDHFAALCEVAAFGGELELRDQRRVVVVNLAVPAGRASQPLGKLGSETLNQVVVAGDKEPTEAEVSSPSRAARQLAIES